MLLTFDLLRDRIHESKWLNGNNFSFPLWFVMCVQIIVSQIVKWENVKGNGMKRVVCCLLWRIATFEAREPSFQYRWFINAMTRRYANKSSSNWSWNKLELKYLSQNFIYNFVLNPFSWLFHLFTYSSNWIWLSCDCSHSVRWRLLKSMELELESKVYLGSCLFKCWFWKIRTNDQRPKANANDKPTTLD